VKPIAAMQNSPGRDSCQALVKALQDEVLDVMSG
jgi:hypothetical protein